MSYIPDATDVTNPIAGTVKAATAAAEFIAIKLYMRDVLLAGLAGKASLTGATFTGNVGIGIAPTSKLHVNGPIALAAPSYVASSTYTVLALDSSLRIAATCVVTLPAPASCVGRLLRLGNIGAVAVTSASANIGQLAGGSSADILPAVAGKWADIQSDGAFWYITAAN